MANQDSPPDPPRDGDTGRVHRRPTEHIGSISTRHPDEHYAWLSARYNDHHRTVRPRRKGFEFFAESAALGELTAGRSRYRAAVAEVIWPRMPYLVVGHLHTGRLRLRWRGGEARVANRGTMLFPPDGFENVHDCSDTSGITVTMQTLVRVAEELRGLEPTRLRFAGVLPISATAEQQWLTTAGYVQRGIYNLALNQPLVLAAAHHVVAASVLTTFPNTTMTEDTRRPRDAATAAVVRRAVAFIDDYASLPVTLTDIATAAGVVPRSLQYAFRRHLDTSPLAYLRSVRLAEAHRELVAAQPGDGTTVAAVAARWGYARRSRFAAAYRRLYGEDPSQTLRG